MMWMVHPLDGMDDVDDVVIDQPSIEWLTFVISEVCHRRYPPRRNKWQAYPSITRKTLLVGVKH